jgi:RimJ/RimL family protein N-acetyltransferase
MERISLRQWRDSDLEPFAAMNSDPEVMRYFAGVMTREESAEMMECHRGLIAERGWGLWAVDVDGELARFMGFAIPRFEAPFRPCIEVGWRLRREYWGRSIAYRAAQKALIYDFEVLNLPEIVAFTAARNLRSRLIERLGFFHDFASDFGHPSLANGHELRAHVLYRKQRAGGPG